jgi:hypothetical protein
VQSIILQNFVTGLIRLLRFDSSFADSFQVTRKQALWSFSLMGPGFLISLLSWFAGRDITPGVSIAKLGVSLLTAFLVNWLIVPALIFGAGRVWNRKQEALDAICFYNCWALVSSFVIVSLYLIFSTETLPHDVQTSGWILTWLFLSVFAIYGIYALRTLLRFDGTWALALLAVNTGVAYLIDRALTPAVLCIPL